MNDQIRGAAEVIFEQWERMPEYRRIRDENPKLSFGECKIRAIEEVIKEYISRTRSIEYAKLVDELSDLLNDQDSASFFIVKAAQARIQQFKESE